MYFYLIYFKDGNSDGFSVCKYQSQIKKSKIWDTQNNGSRRIFVPSFLKSMICTDAILQICHSNFVCKHDLLYMYTAMYISSYSCSFENCYLYICIHSCVSLDECFFFCWPRRKLPINQSKQYYKVYSRLPRRPRGFSLKLTEEIFGGRSVFNGHAVYTLDIDRN